MVATDSRVRAANTAVAPLSTSLWYTLLRVEKSLGKTHAIPSAVTIPVWMNMQHDYRYPVNDTATTATSSSTQRMTIEQTAIGLLCQRGILPDHYLDTINTHRHQNHSSLDALLHFFNQSWIWLYYRAWKKNRLSVQHSLSPTRNP